MTVRQTVQVVDYDKEWPKQFTAIKKMLNKELADSVVSIEHVGSTSVPSLAGKPILDIDIVISSMEEFPNIKRQLTNRLDYIHVGNQGVEGREVFERSYKDEFMAYHLYVCVWGSPPYRYHIEFRDYLRTHPEAVKEYAQLKRVLAVKHADNLMAYFHEKSQFVEKILQKSEYSNKRSIKNPLAAKTQA